MSKKKFEKKIINLSNEDIKRIRKQKAGIDLQLESSELAVYSLRKQVELDIPMRNAKMQLEEFESQLERLKTNQKALEKQLRTKTIINLVPK